MRTLLRWLVVTFGIAALVRWYRRRRATPAQIESPAAPAELEDPAKELRRKLAETRSLEEEAEPAPGSESSLDERRADVHAQGRAALAEMTPPDES